MKNFIATGETLTLNAPAAGVTAGQPQLIGGLLVVPLQDAILGDVFTALYRGVFRLNKTAANTPAQLAKAYWDNTTSEVTTTATGNKLAGVFMQAGIAGQSEIEVLLSGAIV